jgi:hypothetical protein
MSSVDANPTGKVDSSEVYSIYKKTFEQDLNYLESDPIGDTLDRFFWKGIFNFPGFDTLNFTADLPEIDPSAAENVNVNVSLFTLSSSGSFIQHHLELYVNGASVAADVSFWDHHRKTYNLEVPADYFSVGNNTIDLKVPGTYAGAGQYDRIFIDKVEFVYYGIKASASGLAAFDVEEADSVFTVGGFTSNQLNIYDVSDSRQTSKLSNVQIVSPDAGATYQATYLAVGESFNEENLKNYEIVQAGSFKSAARLSLTPGYFQSLKDTSRTGKFLIIGHNTLLKAAEQLVSRRQGQGLSVQLVTLDQIYGEFSDGKVSSQAVQDFVGYARANWTTPPAYLLLLGDATYDPRNRNVLGNPNDQVAALEKETWPMPYFTGRFLDFGSDNFFAIDNSSYLPNLSVGRLPTNDPQQIEDYIQKVISYEDGTASPSADRLTHVSFIVDEDQAYEKFRNRSDTLSNSFTNASSKFTTSTADKSVLGSNAATKTAIVDEFNDSPFMISMLGHGASDRWGDGTFLNTDAAALTNSKYPIAITWNCESAQFYDADNSIMSLGEKLVLNRSGGAIAYLGSTTLTTPPAQMKLAGQFFNALAAKTNSPDSTSYRLGDLFREAKVATGSGAYEKDIVNSFSMIGDPTLKIPASLFPDPPQRSAPSSGGGCSLFGADGEVSQMPWWQGLLEWIFLFMMIFCVNRFTSYIFKP